MMPNKYLKKQERFNAIFRFLIASIWDPQLLLWKLIVRILTCRALFFTFYRLHNMIKSRSMKGLYAITIHLSLHSNVFVSFGMHVRFPTFFFMFILGQWDMEHLLSSKTIFCQLEEKLNKIVSYNSSLGIKTFI